MDSVQRMAVPEPPQDCSWRSFMDVALEEAFRAAAVGEAPIGAALFSHSGKLLARAHNQPISLHDPTAHAEVLCLRHAAESIGNYRLSNTILAVTLEPCIMCVGALIHARVAGVVFGATDPRAGALVSNLSGHALPFANHRMWYVGGVQENECADTLKRFFLKRRKQ
ncbi:nucleoside deaminase [Pseudodesulfovibrio senegalensis]|uniref:tRNA-specific adenosine deaminase n=1 Tax=Pseudodesulfovibrio senegalensis TaxID=1721087 RepID=A0A6N6N7X0_9BACT|nr:nucleoside deaminase [Pseudodesulfovibrio senegalensis]KAB1443748.1 nucleoside deaminase [Pseudodesulfovibrio senegalensis]